jgi:hypothetical protein
MSLQELATEPDHEQEACQVDQVPAGQQEGFAADPG